MSIGLVLFSVRAPQWLECDGPHRHEPGHLGSRQLCLCSLAHSNDSNPHSVNPVYSSLHSENTDVSSPCARLGGGSYLIRVDQFQRLRLCVYVYMYASELINQIASLP